MTTQLSIDPADLDFNLDYEGYLWYSNQRTPLILRQKKISSGIFTKLPFIIEGMLYSRRDKISLTIRTVNGQYQVFQADLKNNDVFLKETIYLSHRTAGFSNYRLVEAWQSVPSTQTAGLKVDQLAFTAFAGFPKCDPK